MKKALNVKNMKETLVNYSGEQKELDKIWNTFWEMACLGFINQDEWKRFFDTCKGQYVTEDTAEVRDSENDDALVWAYNPETVYRA